MAIKSLAISANEESLACVLENNQVHVLSLSLSEIIREPSLESLSDMYHGAGVTGVKRGRRVGGEGKEKGEGKERNQRGKKEGARLMKMIRIGYMCTEVYPRHLLDRSDHSNLGLQTKHQRINKIFPGGGLFYCFSPFWLSYPFSPLLYFFSSPLSLFHTCPPSRHLFSFYPSLYFLFLLLLLF